MINLSLAPFKAVSDVSFDEKINWLRLSRSQNIGKTTFFRLLTAFGSAQKALEAIPSFSKQKIKIFPRDEAARELELTEKFGAKILLFIDEKYPRLLREIPDPAPILTVKGDLEFFNRNSIAIVGPRNASFHATSFAKKIALELGQRSVITVSGMARGVDSAVHAASILSGTVAVIAGGINHIYPKENSDLYEKIACHGLLVSENYFNASPIAGNFVQRNRIVSGLSLATIVVEAGMKSGSLITARCAIEQGREVFAVPGSPFDPRCQGANRLIKDGANMLETIDDILEAIPTLSERFLEAGRLDLEDLQRPPITDFKDIDKTCREILQILSFAPMKIEEISQEIQLPSSLVNIALVQLELAEKIEISFGKVVLKIS